MIDSFTIIVYFDLERFRIEKQKFPGNCLWLASSPLFNRNITGLFLECRPVFVLIQKDYHFAIHILIRFYFWYHVVLVLFITSLIIF